MFRPDRWFFAFALLISFAYASASSALTPPTPQELSMTSDPAAPGAPAVYLLLEQTADNEQHLRTFHARIKILTEAGRDQFSDVTIPFEDGQEAIRNVEAWTIHSDGKIIPFSGKPWQKVLVKSGDVRYMEEGFSLPDVQVGSILEYRYQTTYDGSWLPRWYLQQPVFVHRAHYFFNPVGWDVGATRFLPPGAVVNQKKGFDLILNDVPPMVEEDNSPPIHSLGYRVLFYYLSPFTNTPDKYWKAQGEIWSKGVDSYAVPGKLKNALAQIVSPGDSDELKLRKIYAAVMKVENMDFTREYTKKEDKAEKLKFRNAADIWNQQRGYDREITMLFLGLVRAAGFKAWAMFVTNRDNNIFSKQQPNWNQLDDELVIVNLGGKEIYFDPGERYCEYAQLHWKHSWTSGIRQTDNGTDFANTPYPRYPDTVERRVAELTLHDDGTVQGTIQITMTGAIALRWRQEALLTDADAVRKNLTDRLQQDLASGVTVNLTDLTGLTDYSQPLQAAWTVSGTLGEAHRNRLLVPGAFFEARSKAPFANAARQNPVYLHYAWARQDQVRLRLPQDSTIEAMPADAHQSLQSDADFVEKYKTAGGTYESGRLERVGVILYPTKDYPALRDFFQKVSTQDQSPLLLKLTPKASQQLPTHNQPLPD